jgi:hypothetical protein
MKVINLESIHCQNIHIYKKYSISVQILLFAITMFLLFCTTSTVGQEIKDKTTVSMDLSTMVPRIEVTINNKGPYSFELDTGAGAGIIDKKLAVELNLKVIDQMKVGSPGSDVPMLMDVISIQELSVSDILRKDLKMITMDLGDIPNTNGILSLNQFSEFLITLNYPERTVSFEKGNLSDSDENILHFSTARGVPSVQIEISGRKKEAYLDSGYPGSFAFPYSIKDALNFITPPVEAGTAFYVDVSYKVWRAKLDGQIIIGNVTYESPEIMLEDRNRDFITIGFEAIKDFAVTIDQKNYLMKFERIEILVKPNQNKIIEDDNEFTGGYGGVRTVTFENDELYLQREGGMKLRLQSIDDNLYKMVLPDGLVAQNVLPEVRFDRNKKNEIYRITFIHEDGKEEYALKDN